MRTLVFVWAYLFASMQFVLADHHQEIDEAFQFVKTTDIPYVVAKLDQKVDNLRTMDLYTPQQPGENNDTPVKYPVILYIHGGGWAFGDKKDVNLKPHFFTRAGFAFVSMNYRLRWDYKIYDQVVDLLKVIEWLDKNGAAHGLDGSNVILMGHAAGGHLASLVITDSSFLKAEGLAGDNIKAVVSIDSTSYDILRLMKELGSFVERRRHLLVFSGDEAVWQAASPISLVATSQT